jgi:hypothetical protein
MRSRLTERDLSRIVKRVIKENKEGEGKFNFSNSLNDFITSFDFSEKGNDELIDFANKLLDGELSNEEFENFKSYFGNDLEFFKVISNPKLGINSIAEWIYKRLKQGTHSSGRVGIFTSNPEALDTLKDKINFS